jgi:hypothetical protein
MKQFSEKIDNYSKFKLKKIDCKASYSEAEKNV